MQHVPRGHGAQRPDLLHADLPAPPLLRQQIHHRFRPIRPIAQQPQIAERFLRTAQLAFSFTQLVAEGDEQFPEAHALVLGQGQDTRDVVALGGLFFFAEVADEVAAVLVAGGHAVEEEGIDVVVEGFVVEE